MSSKKTSHELWFIIVRIGRIVRPLAVRMSTMNVLRPSVRFAHCSRGVVRASSSIRSECSARDVQIFWPLTTYSSPSRRAVVRSAVVSVPLAGSVTPKACSRSDPRGDAGQVLRLLRRAAMAQDGAHHVHLGVAGAAVATLALHLLQDRRRGRQRQPGAAVFLGDQRSEVARLRQRLHERRRIPPDLIQPAPILAGEAGAQACDARADLGVGVVVQNHPVHDPRLLRPCARRPPATRSR